ncbi:hypothetical protein [Aliiglaciecola lipolytica]|uniref:Fungal lipase-like domain-containing protein n=1 Tax=Aliiglaciecola lipolytica E3 TaxID=1127673 RepID=K6Y4S6_9ALTE|nr:hypothetical protein [Aliiglaciecola lipolytica]GAC13247.1 hypothetical protein GLIP_0601 [Aliiglaciecola lipolytica E3]
MIIPGIPFVLTTLGFAIYVYWPRDFSSVTQFPLQPDLEYITLSAHGVKGSPEKWSDELQNTMATSPPPQLSDIVQQNHSIDWRNFSNNVFLCSVAGKKIGIEIGKRLAKQSSVKAIHAIGHSCGAFVVFGICEGAKSVNHQVQVQTTYLDPVSVFSGIFWEYGIDNFGKCGDFSDTYIDTRDTVPGSNQILPHSQTLDVTSLQTEKDAGYSPHDWPTRYYIQAIENNKVPIYYKSESRH